jgi:hypothetical protein
MNGLIKPVLITTVALGGIGLVVMTIVVLALAFHATTGSL